ncbi:glycosyltransferase family 2 protein [Jatrophihabitans telluris]|uniref:Glycosyltransferase family 2 protein n=1 Tax=Jatrophihabitans telluris TaxID=2038343 RepID=A0ABY4QY13_9ACTN|nr:glycosyltransferase family 2 protein [Jatrophihabitans telluris]UQX87774.1 glycosyltransferase family 2 protein [Jatrophihabitans telluris]
MIDLVLPCLDEAAALPGVLERVPAGVRPIVVDNGSADGSAELAARLGASVVSCAQRGYGAACHAGLSAATAEYVAFCDCDGSLDPADVPRLAAPIIEGRYDLVLGARRTTTLSAWPVHARVANRVLAHRVRSLTGVRIRDLGPLRVARREDLLELGQRDRRSGYPLETVLLAARAGWRIDSVDVHYAPRTGRSKVTGTVRGTLQAVKDMSAVMAR